MMMMVGLTSRSRSLHFHDIPPPPSDTLSLPPSQSASLSIGLFDRFVKTERKVMTVCCMGFLFSGAVSGMVVALLVQVIGLDALLTTSWDEFNKLIGGLGGIFLFAFGSYYATVKLVE